MKLTKQNLRNLVKEELSNVIHEQSEFYLEEGRYEEDPDFKKEMNMLGKDLGNVIAYLKSRDESGSLNLSALPIEFRAVAGGQTKPCIFSARLEKINNATGQPFGGGQPGIMAFMKKYPACATK